MQEVTLRLIDFIVELYPLTIHFAVFYVTLALCAFLGRPLGMPRVARPARKAVYVLAMTPAYLWGIETMLNAIFALELICDFPCWFNEYRLVGFCTLYSLVALVPVHLGGLALALGGEGARTILAQFGWSVRLGVCSVLLAVFGTFCVFFRFSPPV
ncbi:hypothetical protein ABI59_06555 [Acidobacteria bacterium Mor1]|nr:hypothetical protein ABI59_06555 [Acidobacteria bacterium Mor1]